MQGVWRSHRLCGEWALRSAGNAARAILGSLGDAEGQYLRFSCWLGGTPRDPAEPSAPDTSGGAREDSGVVQLSAASRIGLQPGFESELLRS